MWVLSVLLLAFAPETEPKEPAAPEPALSAEEAGRTVQELWKHRDDPAAMTRAKKILDQALARHPDDYGLLWRMAAWYFWKSDDPELPTAERTKMGKEGWAVAERAVTLRPDDAAGHFWAATTMGNYSLGIGVIRALSQRIEGKFRSRISEAEKLDPAYGQGAIPNTWGRYYASLPWPKRDRDKAERYYRKALEINPHNLRSRVYLAELALDKDRPAEAKKMLDEVLQSPVGKYDPPEEKRAKVLARQTMRQVDQALR
jgi:tetratricopeptide (TPR) repeat protein